MDIRYLGIFISDDLADMWQGSVTLLMHNVKIHLRQWDRLNCPGMAEIATIKLKVLPQLLFLFQNLFTQYTQEDIAGNTSTD